MSGSPYSIVAALGTLKATNYSFTFVNGTLTITKANPTIAVTPYSVTYNASPHTATGTVTGVINDTLAGLDLSGTTHTGAGTYTDTWTFTDVTGNYNNASGTVTDTIAKATLTVSADSKSKVLNAPNPALTYTITGLLGGDTLAGSVSGAPTCSTTATTISPASNYPITWTLGTLASANYSFTFVSGTLSIVYRFDGFLQPINDTGHVTCGPTCPLSIFKAGSTIPVKFQLKDVNGNVVQSSVLPVWAVPQLIGPTNSTVDETAYNDTPTPGDTFRWDGTEYIYNFSTKGYKAGYI